MNQAQLDDIAEVTRFAVDEDHILTGENHRRSDDREIVIRDIEVAASLVRDKAFAWRHGQTLKWGDFRQNELGEVTGKAEGLPGYQADMASLVRMAGAAGITVPTARLPFNVLMLLEGEVGFDLNACVYNRYVNGRADTFFERIFQAYKAGLWPCGIEGDFAGGNYKLICWQPPEDLSTIKY